jgi:hypothetical protein
VICPNCGAEYRPGFTRCSDCDAPLVERRAAQELKPSQRSLRPVVGRIRRYLPDIVGLAVLLLANHYLPRPLVLFILLAFLALRLLVEVRLEARQEEKEWTRVRPRGWTR